MGPTTANEMKNLRKGRSPERKMGYSIGTYKGYDCYQLGNGEKIPSAAGNIYVDSLGDMYYGGVRVGRLTLPGYNVKEFDMGIYEAKMRAKRTRDKEVAVPACVAECTSTTAAVGKEMELCGTDEFFARVALDIEETLKSAGKFNG